MKALIPVAGVGTRLRPLTHTLAKVLLKVAGKPILGYIMDELVRIGITEMVLIVGYLADQVEKYVKETYRDIKVEFVHQEHRQGLGHAVYLARDALGKDPVFIILGDTIFQTDFEEIIALKTNAIGVKPVDNPKRFGIVELEGERVARLVEKPDNPTSNLAIVGLYYIRDTELLLDCLQKNIEEDVRTKGEYQLTDGLQRMITEGADMTTFILEGWFDCGKPETLLATNRHLLEVGSGRRISEYPGSIIKPPVFISPTARIEDSIIGPYVSIAEGCTITNSILRDTIINDNAAVRDANLNQSLVGDNAEVYGGSKSLVVGDSSMVNL